jgi:putative endonuclease
MLREHHYYVYIMQSSTRRALYIGMTNNLQRRVFQHKTQECEGFTGSYDAVRLVYWESLDDVHKTIAREKQLKNWRREKKLWLIARMNPEFRDLAADWYEKENLNARRAWKPTSTLSSRAKSRDLVLRLKCESSRHRNKTDSPLR